MRNVARQSLRAALFGAAAMALVMGASHHASAQSIEASDLVPAPDGTNLLLGYYTYNHYDSDHTPSGKVSASVNGNLFIERYVHYSYLGNTPAGFQFLALNGWNTGTNGGASANTGGELEAIVSGFIWPGANTATKTYPFVGFYLYPPINSAGYGSNAWSGSLLLGIDKGFDRCRRIHRLLRPIDRRQRSHDDRSVLHPAGVVQLELDPAAGDLDRLAVEFWRRRHLGQRVDRDGHRQSGQPA
jgi:hypothetical protein